MLRSDSIYTSKFSKLVHSYTKLLQALGLYIYIQSFAQMIIITKQGEMIHED